MRHTAYIALGSNLGDRAAHLRSAVVALGAQAGEVAAISPVYEAAAHTLSPDEAQPAYLNAVAQVETALSPEALLAVLLEIERRAGRERRRRWEARPLDLDLLLYDDLVSHSATLTLPHPRLAERRFVLLPLHDLVPGRHVPPPFDATVGGLLAACPDRHPLQKTPLSLLDKPTGA